MYVKKKKIFFIILILVGFYSFSQDNKTLKKVDWNAYVQLRATGNFNDYTSMMVRRLKFWLKSTSGFSAHWSYKVQALFTGWKQERFFLQDVKINYQTGLFNFDIGQFVPQYSLQWTQPDYNIASIERAIAVNTLHPDGSLGVRDIGVQANFHTKNNVVETHLGAFNGYGINEYRFDNQGYMFSHKTAVNFPLQKNKLQVGYSLMYRYAQNLQIRKVLPDTLLYSGKDIRYNVFTRFKSKFVTLQAEYLNAGFEDRHNASGYYILSIINHKKSQIILQFEDYKNAFEDKHYPYYRFGYNYLINKNKIKMFLDNHFQIIDDKIKNYYASVELQMFFK